MISRDREFLIEIARKYYIDGLSQQEIAGLYKISRPTVASLLKRCREERIVEIRIQESEKSRITSLTESLGSVFPSARIILIPTENEKISTLISAGRTAAELLSSLIMNRMKIGLSWGSSLYQVVKELPLQDVTGIEVIQLAGSMGMKNTAYDGFELTRELAKKLNGVSRFIQAPVIVKNPELKELLIQEHPIKETMRYMSSLNIAVVGLSSDRPEYSSMVREGFLDADEADFILSEGGIGHICGLHYDKFGNFLTIQQNNRVVGINREQLLKIPEVIGIACGTEKAEAILGALRGGLIKSLVTDENTAIEILNLAE